MLAFSCSRIKMTPVNRFSVTTLQTFSPHNILILPVRLLGVWSQTNSNGDSGFNSCVIAGIYKLSSQRWKQFVAKQKHFQARRLILHGRSLSGFSLPGLGPASTHRNDVTTVTNKWKRQQNKTSCEAADVIGSCCRSRSSVSKEAGNRGAFSYYAGFWVGKISLDWLVYFLQ